MVLTVCICKYNVRTFSSKFQCNSLQIALPCCFFNQFANLKGRERTTSSQKLYYDLNNTSLSSSTVKICLQLSAIPVILEMKNKLTKIKIEESGCRWLAVYKPGMLSRKDCPPDTLMLLAKDVWCFFGYHHSTCFYLWSKVGTDSALPVTPIRLKFPCFIHGKALWCTKFMREKVDTYTACMANSSLLQFLP